MIQKIILGTAQLGMPYGINNSQGKLDKEIAIAILNKAYDSGIRALDTADSYGDSKKIIGEFHRRFPEKRFEICTKFNASSSGKDIRKHVETLLKELNIDHLAGYMFHSMEDYQLRKADIHSLSDLRQQGIITEVGVAVYTNKHIEEVVNDRLADMIQLPFNLLDNLAQREKHLRLAKEAGLTIQVRSVFLQGLFFKSPNKLSPTLAPIAPVLEQINRILEHEACSIGQIALDYALHQDLIDYVLLGVDSEAQLIQNLQWVKSSQTKPSLVDKITSIKVDRSELLNPVNWNINTLVITQARMGSSRLPGKIMRMAGGEALLQIHIDRIKKSKYGQHLLVATTTSEADLAIEKMSLENDCLSFRGSENDVLDRFYQAARRYNPKWVVRLTSDCPLIDPKIIDEVVDFAHNNDCDYCSNSLEYSYPDGQNIEIFKMSALEKAWKEAKLISQREHVTPYIYNNSDLRGGNIFKAYNIKYSEDYGDVRITVDEKKDLEVIQKLVQLHGKNADWLTYAKSYIGNKEIKEINENIIRNEGYIKSLEEDEKIKE